MIATRPQQRGEGSEQRREKNLKLLLPNTFGKQINRIHCISVVVVMFILIDNMETFYSVKLKSMKILLIAHCFA